MRSSIHGKDLDDATVEKLFHVDCAVYPLKDSCAEILNGHWAHQRVADITGKRLISGVHHVVRKELFGDTRSPATSRSSFYDR